MTKVDSIIEQIEQADESEIMEFNFDPCFKLMKEMEGAMITFVERVELGDVRSIRTYTQFNNILGRTPVIGEYNEKE